MTAKKWKQVSGLVVGRCSLSRPSVKRRKAVGIFKVISGALVLMIFGVLPANAIDQSICIAGSKVVLYPNGALQSCVLKDSFRSNGAECKQQSPVSFYDNGQLETCVLEEETTIDDQKCKQSGPIRFYSSGEFQSCVKQD